jgi:hypothetical protein
MTTDHAGGVSYRHRAIARDSRYLEDSGPCVLPDDHDGDVHVHPEGWPWRWTDRGWQVVSAPLISADGAAIPQTDLDNLKTQRDEARAALRVVWELHTDSPAGVCPTCYRLADVSDTDDGLVPWPCPTILAIDPAAGRRP